MTKLAGNGRSGWKIGLYALALSLGGAIALSVVRGGLVDGSDLDFPLRPGPAWLAEFLSVWGPTIGLGQSFTRGIPQLPYQAVIVGLFSLTHSLLATQAILFGIAEGLAPIAFAYLARSIGIRDPGAIFFGAIAYACAPLLLLGIWGNIDTEFLQMAAGPFFLGAVIRYVQSPRAIRLLSVCVASICASASGNELFVIAYVLILGISVALVGLSRASVRPIARFVIAMTGVVLANLFWIAPTAMELQSDYRLVVSNTVGQTPLEQLHVATANATIAHILEGTPAFTYFTTYMGSPYYAFTSYFTNPIVRSLEFGVVVVALFAIFWRRPHAGLRAWMLLTLLLFLVACLKGIQDPWGEQIYGLIFGLPFGAGFRNPLDKFLVPVVLVVALLNSYAFSCLRRGRQRSAFATAVGAAALLACVPLMTNTLIRPRLGVMPAQRAAVPSYYTRLSSVPEFQHENRYLPYPYIENFFGTALTWGQGFVGPNPDRQLLPNRGVFSTSDPLPLAAAQAIERGQLATATALLADLGIDYVISHDDLDLTYHSGPQFPSIGRVSDLAHLGFRPAARVGALTLWRSPVSPLPAARLTADVLSYTGDAESLAFVRRAASLHLAGVIDQPDSKQLTDLIPSVLAQASPDCAERTLLGPCSEKQGEGHLFVPFSYPWAGIYDLYDYATAQLLARDVHIPAGHGAFEVAADRGWQPLQLRKSGIRMELPPDTLVELRLTGGGPKPELVTDETVMPFKMSAATLWTLRLQTGDDRLLCALIGAGQSSMTAWRRSINSRRLMFLRSRPANATAGNVYAPVDVRDGSWYQIFGVPAGVRAAALVTSTGYDSSWALFPYRPGLPPLLQPFSRGRFLATKHVRADGYANAWLWAGATPGPVIAIYLPELAYAAGALLGLACLVMILVASIATMARGKRSQQSHK